MRWNRSEGRKIGTSLALDIGISRLTQCSILLTWHLAKIQGQGSWSSYCIITAILDFGYIIIILAKHLVYYVECIRNYLFLFCCFTKHIKTNDLCLDLVSATLKMAAWKPRVVMLSSFIEFHHSQKLDNQYRHNQSILCQWSSKRLHSFKVLIC